jgi:DNA-binding NarL/FixJ family response regulator
VTTAPRTRKDAPGAAAKVGRGLERSEFVETLQPTSRNGHDAKVLPVAVCVEDQALRDRVCATLEAGGHSIHSQVSAVDELLASCSGRAPACFVIAAGRPDRAAIEAVRLIRSEVARRIAVVLVCWRAGAAQVRRALDLGVDGVVLIEETETALAAVVAVVCAGQVSVPSDRRGEVRTLALTNREKQILALVVIGRTNAQIAHELFLAESTVKSHLSSAFGKLGVSSRNEAASMILDPERGRGLGIREVSSGAHRPAVAGSSPR